MESASKQCNSNLTYFLAAGALYFIFMIVGRLEWFVVYPTGLLKSYYLPSRQFYDCPTQKSKPRTQVHFMLTLAERNFRFSTVCAYRSVPYSQHSLLWLADIFSVILLCGSINTSKDDTFGSCFMVHTTALKFLIWEKRPLK